MKQQDSRPPGMHWGHLGGGTPNSRAVVGGLPWANEGESPTSSDPIAAPAADGTPLPRIHTPQATAAADCDAAKKPGAERLAELIRQSPAWSVSLSVHCLLFILLALWVIREHPPRRLRLDLAFGTATGRDAAGDGGGPVAAPQPMAEEKTDVVDLTPAPVKQPQPVVPTIPETPVVPATDQVSPATAVDPQSAPAVGKLLTGRDAARRAGLLGAAGGSESTEAAVAMALEWLRRRQGDKDGLWSLQSGYDDGGSQENRLAATAMALLAFQGAGNTRSAGPYSTAVDRGWRSLLKSQQPDGSFDVGSLPNLHGLYSHAQATMALCELYGMSRDEKLAEPAARAVAYCVAAQGSSGGWKYEPGKGGDMSVTGWYMLALKSAEMAGMQVPPETFPRLSAFLDTVAIDSGSRYGYQRNSPLKPASPVTAAVTAEGLLCRQYLGWPQRDPRILEGLELLLAENSLDFEREKDVYAWYYITQVAHHVEGDPWRRWNAQLREVLPREQVASGREKGSWDPSLDRWGHVGGRLFMTCFCTYMLEVYYRHLPLYSGVSATER